VALNTEAVVVFLLKAYTELKSWKVVRQHRPK
jgi:hypothetical protein